MPALFSFSKPISSIRVILYTALFWMTLCNYSMITQALSEYPVNADTLPFLLSLPIGFIGITVLVLGLFCHRYTLKPVLITLLLGSSAAAYFMDSYHVVIDEDMLRNILATNTAEASDLFSLKLLGYIVVLGVLPAWLLYRIPVKFGNLREETLSRLKLTVLTLAIMALTFGVFSAAYTSFFREHKAIRQYFNPGSYVFAAGKYIARSWLEHTEQTFTVLDTNAAIPETDKTRELVIMVVGETARADRFSLNGYERETNPLLAKENVISFTQFTSCGTSTNISVPCMFSLSDAPEFDTQEALTTENALDILNHADVNLLWRDNNSSSKGVADRILYQDFRDPELNPVCDEECRDEGMLHGLQDYIDSKPKGDITIILHQMGNHGPAYYKRYPKAFERFTPVCRTNELSACTEQEINNAYDNAILYTDYFLSKVIALLKQNDDRFETAMFYVSDHGESLGENGLYLHGMPNFIAPDFQRQVPVIMWLGKNFHAIRPEALAAKRHQPFNHDTVFHTLLGMMEIESTVYNKQLDLIHN